MFLVVKKNLKKVKASKFLWFENKSKLMKAIPGLKDNNDLLVPEDPTDEWIIRILPIRYKKLAIIYEGEDLYAYPLDFDILHKLIAQKYKIEDVVDYGYILGENKVVVSIKTRYGVVLQVPCIVSML
jgi:hypothetical protein